MRQSTPTFRLSRNRLDDAKILPDSGHASVVYLYSLPTAFNRVKTKCEASRSDQILSCLVATAAIVCVVTTRTHITAFVTVILFYVVCSSLDYSLACTTTLDQMGSSTD